MYIDLHTHKIRLRGHVVAVYSALPNSVPAELPENWFASVGIHPWLCGRATFKEACRALGMLPDAFDSSASGAYEEAMRNWLDTLEQLASRKRIIAVGETGLDRAHDRDLAAQNELFEAHLQLAERYGLPVIIHCVRAFSEILAMRKTFDKTPWIVHGFRGHAETARQLIRHNIHVSFGEALLKSRQLQVLARDLEPAFMFLESDASEVRIEDVYAGAADAMGVDLEWLQRTMAGNFNRVFDQRI